MRFLFVTGGGSATVFAIAPLASAARNAGHEVIVAAPEEDLEVTATIGLPAVAVTPLGILAAMFTARDGSRLAPPMGEEAEIAFAARGFARQAASSDEALNTLAADWRPDVIVGGSQNHAAPLIAYRFGIPFVRHSWDFHERSVGEMRAADDELRPELDRLGLLRIPECQLYVEITPQSIRPPDAEPAQMMRWTPGNRQVPLAPWMYTPSDRPRVCITSGSRSLLVPALGSVFFQRMLSNPTLSDVDLVVATSDQVAAQLATEFPNVRGGWFPLDVVAHTCDLIIHHGGGVTTSTAMWAGVPQLVLPVMKMSATPARRIDEFGASITLPSNDVSAEDLSAACKELLTNPSYRERAQALRREIAGAPPAAEVVRVIEALAA